MLKRIKYKYLKKKQTKKAPIYKMTTINKIIIIVQILTDN